MKAIDVVSKIKEVLAGFIAREFPLMLVYLSAFKARNQVKVRVFAIGIDIIDHSGKRIIRLHRRSAHYLDDMIKCFDYYHGAAETVPWYGYGGKFYLMDFSTPRYHDVVGFCDFPMLCPSLVEPYVTVLQYMEYGQLKKGDIVFDLGCYSGLTSIAFSKVVGQSGCVVCVEPDVVSFGCAVKNINNHSRINWLNNINIYDCAVASRCGEMEFSTEGAMGSADARIVGSNRGDSTIVVCLDLMALLELSGMPKVDFIKMDIEGSELDVISSSKVFLMKYRPKLIIEPHIVDGALNGDAILSVLRSIGYKAEYIEQTGVLLPLICAEPLVDK